ncbi:MAG: hypothetical protein LH465_03015 [Sphingomonas bacterium]|nr:hypothetical protein [Sphingomonas bacterium]
MLFGFEGQFARFIAMDRESYARSIFFDGRVQPADQQFYRVPLEPLLAHLAETGFKPPRIGFIHHFAQSGSTLLARALDHPGNLVIREPLHLRELGVRAGAANGGSLTAQQRALLEFSLSMLGKRFEPGSSLIVKGSVPVSLLASEIADLDPGRPAILLHFPLDDYCAAVLRTPNHQRWVESVTGEIGLERDPLIGDIAKLTVAEKAAALWYSMIKRFERLLALHPAMRSLDANQFFDRPGATIVAANELFDAGLGAGEARTVADGPLFATYSKNPRIPYDPATRVERREQAKTMLKAELGLARRWVEQRSGPAAVPPALDRPLLGQAAPLF